MQKDKNIAARLAKLGRGFGGFEGKRLPEHPLESAHVGFGGRQHIFDREDTWRFPSLLRAAASVRQEAMVVEEFAQAQPEIQN